MSRDKKDAEERKNEFIEAATKLFISNGYEVTSTREILKQLGGKSALSPSVFYYYFKSKEELFEKCMTAYVDHYADRLINILENDKLNNQARLKLIIVQISEVANDFVKLHLNQHENMQIDNLQLQLFDHLHARLEPQISAVIDDGIKSGEFPLTDLAKEATPQITSRLIMNGIFALFHENLGSAGTYAIENLKLIPIYVAQVLGLPARDLL